jgi:hypothetical protein
LGLGILRGHPALVKDNIDFIFCPLDVGVDSEARGGSTKKRVDVARCFFVEEGESTSIISSSPIVLAFPFLEGPFVFKAAVFGMVASSLSSPTLVALLPTSSLALPFAAILELVKRGGVRKHYLIIIINWQTYLVVVDNHLFGLRAQSIARYYENYDESYGCHVRGSV